METTGELLWLRQDSGLNKKGLPSGFITMSLESGCAVLFCSFRVALKGSDLLFITCFLDVFRVVPIPIILKFRDDMPFSSLCWALGSLKPFLFSLQWIGLGLMHGPQHSPLGFTSPCSAKMVAICLLSISPDFGSLSYMVWPSFLFSCLCEFIYFSFI